MASITITGSNIENSTLSLSDHGKTEANRGEVVTWVIAPDSGVRNINAITIKSGSTNVFISEPKQLGNSSNWQGIVNSDLVIPATGEYSIFWSDENGTNHEFDPIIQVNT